jgi:hypothetical protein
MLSITQDAQGGYHVSETAKEMLAEVSLLTAVKYQASKTETWSWCAGAVPSR